MDILKTLRSQVEQVEVVEVKNEATKINFESNHFKGSQVEATSGTALRVIRDGRLGFSASTLANAQEKLIQNALESAAYGDKLPITFPSQQPSRQVTTYDDRITALPVSRLVEIGQEVVDIILSASPQARVNISLERAVQRTTIRNQAGLDVTFDRSPLSGYVEVIAIQGDDVLILGDLLGFTVWADEFKAYAHRIAEKLTVTNKITTLKSGYQQVLFSPNGSLVLGMPLNEGLNGKNVFLGTSPLRDKLGEKLFDSKFSLVDDGTLPGRFASAQYDDEGIPHQRLPLVQAGTVKSFYYDLKTAVQSGVTSTGNGARSLFAPPRPSHTNLVIQPGERSFKEIIAGIEDGILVDSVLGLGQGNIISGAFSNPLDLAFRIEKGEITGRVKGASIAGNVYDILKNVAAISREQDWVYQTFCSPYILIDEMNVVSA